MAETKIDWAGLSFIAVGPHDAALFKAPGFYGFARREWNGERTLLYVDRAEVIAVDAAPGAPRWTEALGLGMNELHVCLHPGDPADLQQLRDQILDRQGAKSAA